MQEYGLKKLVRREKFIDMLYPQIPIQNKITSVILNVVLSLSFTPHSYQTSMHPCPHAHPLPNLYLIRTYFQDFLGSLVYWEVSEKQMSVLAKPVKEGTDLHLHFET